MISISPFVGTEMTSWAARMHRRAAVFGNVVTSCGHSSGPYSRRMEKVKFGVSLEEVCKNDIPGPLLVLILKLNKEAAYRKDVFRAPGHQGAMKKLIHFLQTGRLVNVDNYSVYTIASVLKKFLRKIPGGVFGKTVEQKFFHVLDIQDVTQQRIEIESIITSLPVHTQRLLVLVFGTFKVIASSSEKNGTGMTSDALGVSVAPSFFHSCVSDGRTARMEDVMKFKVASRVVKFLIEQFSASYLFGRDNYEFYSRVTGRVLRIQGEWICSFQYPPQGPGSTTGTDGNRGSIPQALYPHELATLERYFIVMSRFEECQSTPALSDSGLQPQVFSTSLGIITESSLFESCTRLSISLEQNGLFQANNNTSHSSSASQSSKNSKKSKPSMTLEELKAVNRYAESTRSLSYLPQVHERQTQRMKTRSQWFLTPSIECTSCGRSLDSPFHEGDLTSFSNTILRRSSSGTFVGVTSLSLSAESIQRRPSTRRCNSRHYAHRSSSRRNKDNCTRTNSFKNRADRRSTNSLSGSFKIKYEDISRSCSFKTRNELLTASNAAAESVTSELTANTNDAICVTLTYKSCV